MAVWLYPDDMVDSARSTLPPTNAETLPLATSARMPNPGVESAHARISLPLTVHRQPGPQTAVSQRSCRPKTAPSATTIGARRRRLPIDIFHTFLSLPPTPAGGRIGGQIRSSRRRNSRAPRRF